MLGYNEILKSVNLESIATSSDIDANSINRNYKLRQTAIFNALREANPHFSAKELAKEMGTSTSTLQRIRRDINMKSPYRYDISTPKRKTVNEPEKPTKPTKPAEPIKGKRTQKKNNSLRHEVNHVAGDDIEENPYKFKMPSAKELLSSDNN